MESVIGKEQAREWFLANHVSYEMPEEVMAEFVTQTGIQDTESVEYKTVMLLAYSRDEEE